MTTGTAGFLWLLSGSLLQSVIRFVVLLVLVRLLTPEDFGVAATGVVVVSLVDVISRFGIGPALVQRKDLFESHIQVAFLASALLAILAAVLLYFGGELAAAFFDVDRLASVLQVLLFMLVSNGMAVVPESLLQREMRFRELATADAISYLLGFALVGIVLAVLDYGVWALIWGNVSQAGIRAVTLWLLLGRRVWPVFDWEPLVDILRFGSGFTLARLANFAAIQGDNIVIAKMLGAEPLAFYGRAYQLLILPVRIFGRAIDTVMFSTQSNRHGLGEAIGEHYIAAIAAVTVTTLPLSVFLFVFAPEVILALFGAQWVETIPVFEVLALGMVFRVSYMAADSTIKAAGAVMSRAWRQLIYAGLVIGGAIIGTTWGVTGVACGILFAIVINYLLTTQLCIRCASVDAGQYVRSLLPGILLAIVVGVLSVLCAYALRQLELGSLATLLLALSIVTGGAVLASWIAPRIFIGSHALAMAKDVIKSRKSM